MSRKIIVAANWKLNKNPEETSKYFEEFLPQIKSPEESSFLFFISDLNLHIAQRYLVTTKIGWGSQNIFYETEGAFTGETSAKVLKGIGGTHVLIGHSERRTVFNEPDEWLAKKVTLAIKLNLIPVICVGETVEQREAGETNTIIENQVKAVCALINPANKIIIAYEPIWAIGTGKVATAAMANQAHAHIRKTLNSINNQFGDKTSILYGGSVKPENAKNLIAEEDIDGFLVGGASLNPNSFYQIYLQASSD